MHREGQTIEMQRLLDAVKIGDTKAAAALVFDLVRLRNSETQNRIIDVLGERIAEIKNSNGSTLVEVLVEYGDSGVQSSSNVLNQILMPRLPLYLLS